MASGFGDALLGNQTERVRIKGKNFTVVPLLLQGLNPMKRRILLGLSALALVLTGAAALLSGGAPTPSYADSNASRASLPMELNGQSFPSLSPLVEATKPAVVSIAIARPNRSFRNPFQGDPFFERFFGNPRGRQRPQQDPRPQPTGSGVIVDAGRGLVLTNHHVIQNATEIEVTLSDGRTIAASVVGSDAGTDVAVLELEETDELTEMALGNSDAVAVGDFVLAIGNPFGLTHTVTSGIVSALGRSIPRSRSAGAPSPIEDFIQTDASINPGNSGGALVNMRGELVGIPSNILSRSGGNIGIGFAIPTSIAREIMRQLVEFGEIRRGRLGVLVQDVSEDVAQALDLASAAGAFVSEVVPDSAAERAGIEPGDVIVKVDNKDIEGSNDLVNTVGLRSVGEEVTLEIVGQDGEVKVVRAELGGTVTSSGDEVHPALAGATLANGEDGGYQGVLVESIAPGSAAERSGLETEDVIFRVNRTDVRNVEQMKAAAENRSLLVLHLARGNRRVVITVRG